MLISTNFLKQSYEKYKKTKESYGYIDSANDGITASLSGFILIMSIIFFILEFLLIYYAISMAIRCTKSPPERVTHLILAIVFTLPYTLVSVFFNKCSQEVLSSGDLLLTNNSKYANMSFR